MKSGGMLTNPLRFARGQRACALVVAVLGLPGVATAQLCDWGGVPTLPVPEVEYLASQSNALRAPARVAVDSGGRVWVTDPTVGAVTLRDLSGGVIEVRSDLGIPVAMAVDAFDGIYLSDQSTGRVDVYDAGWNHTGSLGTGTGEFASVTDIAVDPDLGTALVFVADGSADLIKVYGPDHQLVRSFGGSGTGPGEFDFPSAVWVSLDGAVFVGDQNNDRVQVFDRDGTFLRCFGAQGGGDRNFGRIQGLAGDTLGRVYVADAFQGHVKVFDPFGVELAVIGGLGDLPGEFRTPFGLVIDEGNRLLVTSVNSGRLEVFGLDDYGVIPPADLLFGDGFESGDVHAWSDAAP